MGIDSDCEEDDTILKFGPSDGTEFGPRVIFGHGVGGLDKYANTFIADMVERWSKDPRLAHVTFLLPTAPTRPVEMLGNKEVPAWFDCAQDASMPNGCGAGRVDAARLANQPRAPRGVEADVHRAGDAGRRLARDHGLRRVLERRRSSLSYRPPDSVRGDSGPVVFALRVS